MSAHDTHGQSLSPRIERLICIVLIAVFALLSIGYSLGPIFEGPDEWDHYQYIRHLASTGTLPNPLEQTGRQYHQAPFYYVLVSPIARLIPDSSFEQYADRINPFRGYLFNIAGNDNKNVFLHSRSEQFPYTGNPTALAVHVIRLVSVLFGVGTLLVCYAIFRLLWPERPDRRLLGLAMVSLWPQFGYMAGVVSNDGLLFLTVTVVLWLLLRQLSGGPSWHGVIILGLVIGVALLVKINAIFLVFPVGLTFALDRRAWRYLPVTLVVVGLVAGWWFVRNAQLYGDPTGAKALFEMTQPGEAVNAAGELVPAAAAAHLPFAYQTFWARFGDGRVSVGEPIYVFFAIISIAGLSGLIWWLLRQMLGRKQHRDYLAVQQGFVVGIFVLAWLGLLVYYSSRAVNGAQGRYLLPGVAGWGAFWSIGLGVWVPRRMRWPIVFCGSSMMLGVALACLLSYFLPAYRPAAAPVRIEHPLSLRYGQAAELIGVEPELVHARPGDLIRVKLVWRAIEPTSVSYQTYLHTEGSDMVRRDSLPATGNLLSTDWLPGQTWTEEYLIPIPESAEEQTAFPLIAGLYNPSSQAALPAIDASGNEVVPTVGRIAISGAAPSFAPAYRFGGIIGLAEPHIVQDKDAIRVCTKWLSITSTSVDYQVFIHLLDSSGGPVTQADFPPGEGQYPTSVWLPGETIEDCRTLETPDQSPDGWRLAIGLYDLATNQRLRVVDAKGQDLENSMVIAAP